VNIVLKNKFKHNSLEGNT